MYFYVKFIDNIDKKIIFKITLRNVNNKERFFEMSKGNGRYLTTGALAKQTDTSTRAIRHYEESDLLHPIKRSKGGRRLYHPQQLYRLKMILRLREEGFSLDEIADVLKMKFTVLSAQEANTKVKKFLEKRTKELNEKIRHLNEHLQDTRETLEILETCRRCYDDWHNSECHQCDNIDQALAPISIMALWALNPQHYAKDGRNVSNKSSGIGT